MKVKLCGFKDEKSILAAIAAKVDFLGFVFCERSARYISPENSQKFSQIIPSHIAKVAVLADADLDFVTRVYQNFNPDYFQFHGSESPAFIAGIRETFPQVKIIKAFSIAGKEDLQQVSQFEDCADLFLLDSKHPSADGILGGAGKVFDWSVLSAFNTEKPWFLSGGLHVANIAKAAQETGAQMVDVSSGIEEVRGEKSVALIEELMGEIAGLQSQ